MQKQMQVQYMLQLFKFASKLSMVYLCFFRLLGVPVGGIMELV